jgi:hypothetical protein
VPSIASCDIQDVQHRKPGPTLPTLIITFDPDPASDKARKRRSSRTGGLSSSSNSHPNSLLFRTSPDERYNIYDWQAKIRAQIKPRQNFFDAPLSPESPSFTTFINPFSPRSPPVGRTPMSPRQELQRVGTDNTFTSTHSTQRERGQTSKLISPSPSLRSKSSNISSQASSLGRPQGYQNMLPIQQMPADLPSPVSTNGFDDQSILGWTSAQGRSSALSSHTRGSNSVSVAGTPPAPRETILDRAFQMRYIPGSDRLSEPEDDGKLSSIARFEALMRDADERLKPKGASSKATGRKANVSGWNLEEEEEEEENDSEDSDMEDEASRPGTSDYAGQSGFEDEDVDPLALSIQEMPTPAQRALEYISGRSTPREISQRRPFSPPAPQPPMSPTRSKTTPPRVQRKERPKSLAFPSNASSPEKAADYDPHVSITSSTATAMKRRSSSSTKRLSLTDFAKRLSSTSSLLLVQTNNSSSASNGAASSRNSRQSSEASFIDPDEVMLHRGLSQSRLSGMGNMGMRGGQMSEMDAKRCGWRGSGLGVFGEGGFL